MLGDEIEIRMEDEIFRDTEGLAIFKIKNGKRYIGRLTFEEIEPGVVFEPTIRVPRSSGLIQSVHDALRRLGVLESADQATVKRLENHLEDMRKLVFKKPEPYVVYGDNKLYEKEET